jgi:hypothetical protein
MTTVEIAKIEAMIDEIQRIRSRTCEPRANTNPRYHAFSLAVTNLRKVADSLRAEA